MNDMAIRLGQALYDSGMSQKELGEKIGVNRATVNYWCNHGTWPSAKYLPAICRTLGVSADWLLFGDEK